MGGDERRGDLWQRNNSKSERGGLQASGEPAVVYDVEPKRQEAELEVAKSKMLGFSVGQWLVVN